VVDVAGTTNAKKIPCVGAVKREIPGDETGISRRRGSVVDGVEQTEEEQPPRGHVRVVYLGPVAPHWEVQSTYGDAAVIEPFRDRTLARLTLLPPHDPQYRRNRERVARDAEREHLELEWDLGVPEEQVLPGTAEEDGSIAP
jgi:hypothetical protein